MKVIIATGGTGGHIFPSLSVGMELKREGHEVRFIGVFGKLGEKIKTKGFNYEELCAKGLTVENLFQSVWCMLKSIKGSFRLLKQHKPDVVVGFGGYAAFPAVFAAACLRIPTLIHEQNVTPGKANIVLSKFVNKVAISFEKSQKYFNKSKVILTGCPCHINLKQINRTEVLSKFGLKEDRDTILVFGGSQGSHRINVEFLKTLRVLKDQQNVQVIHSSGRIDYRSLSEEYKKINIPYRLYDFLDGIENAYKVADLVISRAGAATVFELARYQVPSVLIPYPYAHEHQRENAKILEEASMAKVIEEPNLNVESLKEAISGILKNKPSREDLEKRNPGIFFPDAAVRLAKEAIALAK